ncbi:MAG: MTAP family purine nucleoside phosphorylase [Phycisphaerae bacterium]
MPITACIAGEEIHRQWDEGRIAGRKIGARKTPFGPSGEVFLVEGEGPGFYLLPRYGAGMAKTSPRKVNYRANMYALKDMGVQCVLAWGPAGAVTHNISVGDLVIPSDIIDLTSLRPRTFFEDSPLGFLRQFPVFCPGLHDLIAEVLHSMKLLFHPSGVTAVCEGPRLETPAEVRMLATMGAELVTHTFVPEVFLAKELQLCYATIAYVVNYAETGSRHRPFAAGELFAGLSRKGDNERLAGAVAAMTQIVRNIAAAAEDRPRTCDCDKTMAHNIRAYKLGDDWHGWFKENK